MKIFYIANSRIPTEKAHGVQIMKMCEAFVKLGHEVKLLVPRRITHIPDEAFAFYGMTPSFKIKHLETLDLIRLSGIIPKVFAYIQNWTFGRSVKKYLQTDKPDLIYSRDELTACMIPENFSLILEVHNISRTLKKCAAFLDQRLQKMVVITQGLKNELVKLGYSVGKIQVVSDGVDLKQFSVPTVPPVNRGNVKKIVYIGNFFAWKGVYILAEAAKFLPGHNFELVGGSPYEKKQLENYLNEHDISNVELVGYVPHNQIPNFLVDADVLVLPNSGKSKISKYYTSPLKMFEYMAAGKPIVASDLPSIREVLNESNAVMVEPDNAEKLAEGIKKILDNVELAKRISRQAAEDAKKYDWQNRASTILPDRNIVKL